MHITFDVLADHYIGSDYGWQKWYDVFTVCRHCKKTTVFVICQTDASDDGGHSPSRLAKAVNRTYKVDGFRSLKDHSTVKAPEHLPKEIENAFLEGATCLAVKCFNGAGTMFRLCIDHATKALLPASNSNGLNDHIRRSLGHRGKWLLDNNHLPESLRDLSTCIREDGNDGAHAGTLKEADAHDLLDFTEMLLERLYTEPERIRLAQQRRVARRAP
jgi:hypothetical protein